MKTALQLGPADHGRALTLEEYEGASYQEGYRYEIIDGRLYVAAAPNFAHYRLVRWLDLRLVLYADQHPEVINFVCSHPRVIVPDRPEVTQPEPDLSAYRDFQPEQPLDALNWQDLHPLLVAEVVSPDDPGKDLQRNVDLYLQVPSIREYWILDPRRDASYPRLLVHRRRGRRWQRVIEVEPGETYTTRFLPDFRLVVDPRA